jgi:hypothetical protein
LTEEHVTVPHRPNLPRFHYSIEFIDPTVQKEIEYEKFNYNIIQPNISPFADSLVNEIFVLFRILWRARGGFTMSVSFSEELDMKEFGDRNAGPYWATHNFNIDHAGNWTADCTYKFIQPTSETHNVQTHGYRVPFFAQDYSRITSNAAVRARKLAKPSWGDTGRTHDEFRDLIEEEKYLNSITDFSFEYSWSGSGYWGNSSDYIVPVAGQHSNKVIPITVLNLK